MKVRILLIGLILAAFLSGFFAGWQRTLSRIGCPPSESDRLREEIAKVQERIQKANQKIAEIQREHPEGKLR